MSWDGERFKFHSYVKGQALIVEVSRMVHDESYRDFAVTARKMLRQCSPYDLPAESYHLWRSFTMRFVARRP